MSQTPEDQPEDLNEDGQEGDFVEDEGQERKVVSATAGAVGGWGISAVVHLTAVAIMWAAVFAAPKVDIEVPPTRINSIPPPVDKKEERLRNDKNVETQVQIETPADTDVQTPVVNNVEAPKENTETVDEPVSPNKGREGAVSDAVEAGGAGFSMSMGVSSAGGASGLMAMRTGPSKKNATLRNGGNRASEIAVEASLRWFVKHQSPNGSWDPEKYQLNCTTGAKCEPGSYYKHQGKEIGNTTVAVTGYAVLCFLGAGYEHQTPNKYRENVRKAIDFILSQQNAKDGGFGRNYEHPIATMALAEAYAMTSDSTLQAPTQKAVTYILAHQNQDMAGGKGLGWDYGGPNKRNDASTTGWNVMALKSAFAANLNVGNGMDGSRNWLEKHWKASNHPNIVKAGYAFKEFSSITAKDQSRFAYTWMTGDVDIAIIKKPTEELAKPQDKNKPGAPAKAEEELQFEMSQKPSLGSKSLECVGLVCGIFLGRASGDPMIESLANSVMEYQVPRGYPTNLYYLYYNTLSMFQLGGERWKTWNGKVRDLLVNSQVKSEDCKDGSWGPEGGFGVGRTLSTAYNTLSLEVYYRYAQVKKQ